MMDFKRMGVALMLLVGACQDSESDGPDTNTAVMSGGMTVASGGVQETGATVATGGMDVSGGALESGGMTDTGSTGGSTGGFIADPNAGSCGTARTTPGCNDQAIMDCVCAGPGGVECCETAWDLLCVELVRSLECKGDCCNATGAKGCTDTAVEASTCTASPDCCNEGWGEFCTIVASANGAMCE